MHPFAFVVAAALSLAPSPHVDRQQAYCLAQNLFWEARSASYVDRVRVATTTLSRARKRGVDVCTEVFTPGAYQWVQESHRDLAKQIGRNNIEKQAWENAVQIAVLKLSGHDLGVKAEIHYFYSPKEMRPKNSVPAWAVGKTVVALSEDFVFLTD